MNQAYFITMAVTAALGTGWLMLRLQRRGMKMAPAILGLVLSVILGWALAKLFYVALLFHRVWPRFGWEAFTRVKSTEFSFFGGCVGVILGMALAARLTKTHVKQFLSVFAPCGALMVAGARYAERYLGMLGVGSLTDVPALCRFPFAVSNEWQEWFMAVFMLAALLALAISLVFALRKKEGWIPGLFLERTAFYLCLSQILCESLRAQGLKWGFVRVEQLLCAVTLVGLLLYSCLQSGERGLWNRFWPIAGALACIGAIVGVEFALDRIDLSPYFWYALMILTLFVLGWLEYFCTRRRFEQVQHQYRG